MIGRLPKPKRNANAGRQPRAIWYRRWARLARRKRVAYARAQAADTMKHLQRQIARFEKLAKFWRVPVDPAPPLPALSPMPDQHWIEHRRDLGQLKPVVKPPEPAPQTDGQALA